jgi:sigma-B regulation protein RsbU (phosphoserine phosphatase)
VAAAQRPPADLLEQAFYDALLDDDAEDLYESAPCGYLSTSFDGSIIKVNGTFLRMIGMAREDVVGARTLQSLMTKGGQIYHDTHYAPLLRMQGFVREIAVEIVRGDGTRLPVLLNSALKVDDAGEPLLVRVAVFDATERRAYERELLAARDAARASEAHARELATTLQASLIPPDPPVITGLDVAAEYRPAGDGHEVGGDFYDVFEVGRGDWGVVLGDVCGKGAAAATVTALARYTVRAAATRSRRPRSILTMLNDALLRQGAERFLTAVYARVRVEPGRVRMTVGCAGHWLPLRVRPDGEVEEIGRTGTILGVFDDVQLDDTTVELLPGDAVVLFTDGVVEARRGEDELGPEVLQVLAGGMAGMSAADMAAGLLQASLSYQEGLPRDDIAIVVLRVPFTPG